MNDSITRISLDIHSTSSKDTVNAKRGDTARKIVISLVDGGIPYVISKDCYAVFTAKKPDGNVVYNDCTIENNTIIYKFTEQTVAVEGRVNSEIKLYGADDKLITSPKFTIAVFGTVYDEGDEIESSDEFNALTRLVSDAMEATENANEAANEARHTAKALMVIGKADGTGIYLDDAIDQYLVGMRIFGKTTQAKTPSMSEPEKLVSAGETGIDVMVSGKNLLQCTAVSASTRGITFTVNSDGTIFANGTATENAYLTIGQVKLHPSTYFLSGDFSGSSSTHRIFITDGVKEYNTYTADRVFTVAETSTWSVRILINAGQSVYNLRFSPMVRLAAIADNSYERYMTAMGMGVTAPNGLHGIQVSSGGTYTDANGQRWLCNELDLGRGVYVTRVKKAVLTADAFTWYLGAASQQTENTTLFYCTVNSKLAGTVNLACDRFPVRYVIGSENDFVGICGHTQYKAVYVRLEGVYTLEEFLAWLVENPITIVYEAVSYIETAIAAEELEAYAALHTYKDHTTVSNSGHAYMELEYVMDAKKYIDSLIGSAGGGASAGIINATVE